MIRRAATFFAVLLLVLTAAGGPARAEAEDRHVLVISIDGLPAFLFDDPAASMPHIRKLAEEGAVSTGGMRVTNPSVTWPTHTSMVTGTHPKKHSVTFNGLLIGGEEPGEPVRVDPRRDKAELVAVPTIYDVAHAAGLSTADVNWPCTRNAETLDWSFPDVPEVFQHTTPELHAELVDAGIIEAETERWDWATTSPASRDDIYTQVAEHIIGEHRPNLMLFHLLDVDANHHRYGEQSWAGYTAVANADANVGRALAALEEAGIRDRTTIFIVADHGFKTAHSTVYPNVMLREAGLLEVEGNQISSARAQVVTVGGGAMVYLLNPETREEDREAVLELFRDAEGVATVLTPDEFDEHHLPDPAENERMADFFLEAARGYGFAAPPHLENAIVEDGPRGHHGYLAKRDAMNAIFVASGYGIEQGAEVAEVNITDLAPTIGELLGLELPTAQGEAVRDILEGR